MQFVWHENEKSVTQGVISSVAGLCVLIFSLWIYCQTVILSVVMLQSEIRPADIIYYVLLQLYHQMVLFQIPQFVFRTYVHYLSKAYVFCPKMPSFSEKN